MCKTATWAGIITVLKRAHVQYQLIEDKRCFTSVRESLYKDYEVLEKD